MEALFTLACYKEAGSGRGHKPYNFLVALCVPPLSCASFLSFLSLPFLCFSNAPLLVSSPPLCRAAATGSHSQVCRSADTRNLLCAGCFVEVFDKIGNGSTTPYVYMSTLKISKGFKVCSHITMPSLSPDLAHVDCSVARACAGWAL